MTCPDCKPLCQYHKLITSDGASIETQVMAITINPTAFEKAAESHRYYSLNSPTRERKFGPWEERDIKEAYAAATRVNTLLGIR